MTEKLDRVFLSKLRQNGRDERRVLDVFSQQPADVYVMAVDDLLSQAESIGAPLKRRNATRVLRVLADNGFGKLIPGRWEHPSRFRSDLPLSRIGGAAAETANHGSKVELAADSGAPAETHRILIRRGFSVSVPADLARAEVDRLIGIIDRLPMTAPRQRSQA